MRLARTAIAALAISLSVSACSGATSFYPPGPAASGSLPSGFMSVKVEAEAPFDFEMHQYDVFFNTSGNGATPFSCGKQSGNARNVSYALLAGGGNASAGPVAFLRSANPAIPATIQRLRAMPEQFTFNPNSDELGTEFDVTFVRNLFRGASPLPAVKPVWAFNVFVSTPQSNGGRFTFVSGLAARAGCFASPKLDVTKSFDVVQYVTVAPSTADPATHLLRVEIENNP
jgi:hypothetical protein